MTTFRLPKGARHLTMPDGTVYRSEGNYRRGRTVEVSDTAHARKIAEAGAVEGACHVVSPLVGTPVEGRECVGCGFQAWKYQKQCPKCGGETREIA